MGQSHTSSQWKGYEHALLNDTSRVQTHLMDDPNRAKNEDGVYTSSKIVRNILTQGLDGKFPGFMDDPDASSSDSKDAAGDDSIEEVGGRVPLATKGKLSTGWQVWRSVATRESNKSKPCFGTRPWTSEAKEDFDAEKRGTYTYESYEECYNQTLNIGLGLRFGLKKFGFDLPENSNIGIFSKNRAEWMLTHLANWSQGYRTVALYDTLGFQSVKYIVGHAGMPVIFTEKDKLATLFKAVEAQDENDKNMELKLKFVVQINTQKKYNNQHESVDEADVAKAKELGLTLIGFTDLSEGTLVKQLAEDNKDEDYSYKEETMAPKAKDLAFVMYTSGTTGDPKGVMLSHRAFACVVGSSARNLSQMPQLQNEKWIHVSYLPLAHSFETAVISVIISNAGQIAFYNGNIKLIGDDWREVKPSLVFGVPRIYNKTYDRVMNTINSATGAKKAIASKAKSTSFKEIRKGRRSVIFDKLVWNGVAPKMGFENAKVIASGAAPLAPSVAEFLRVACKGAAIVQGYGMTETTAISFFTALDDLNLGHVGCPVDNVEYRLIDVPDKEYFVEPRTEEDKQLQKDGKFYPKGEIQMRGPTMMDGYYKNEEATKKTISDDGWLSTGDIGRINPNGTLSIVDRAKAIFKLERGEYISPEKVEIVYGHCPAIAQIMVTGNSNLELPVAMVVPDGQWMQRVFRERKGDKVPGCDAALDSDWSDEDDKLTVASAPWVARINAISSKNVAWIRAAIKEELAQMDAHFKEELRHEERIADMDVVCEIDVMLQGFTIEKNTLTPSFKLKRRIIEMTYKDQLEAMYAKQQENKKNKKQPAKPAAAAPAQDDKKEDAPATGGDDAAVTTEKADDAAATTEDAPADAQADAPADAPAATEDAPAATEDAAATDKTE